MCNRAVNVIEYLRGTHLAKGTGYKLFLVGNGPNNADMIWNLYAQTGRKIEVGKWYNFSFERYLRDNGYGGTGGILPGKKAERGFCVLPSHEEASRVWNYTQRNADKHQHEFSVKTVIYKVSYRRGICRKIENGMIAHLVETLIVGSYRIEEQVTPLRLFYWPYSEQQMERRNALFNTKFNTKEA